MNRCVVDVSPGIAGVGQDDGKTSVGHLDLNSLDARRRFQRRALGAVSSENKKIGREIGARKVPNEAKTAKNRNGHASWNAGNANPERIGANQSVFTERAAVCNQNQL